MPFTPSHAVVALPFARTPLVPAAVAVGAMTPDLPLFTRGLGLPYGATHSWAWLPVTMLLACALLLVWRCVVRPAAGELVPLWVAQRLPRDWSRGVGFALRETFPSARGVAWLITALAVGVITHVVWDSFTHEGRAGVALLPVLNEMWGPLLGYKWLQYVSGFAGLAIIAVWALRWLRRRTPNRSVVQRMPQGVRMAWWLSLPAFLIVAIVLGFATWGPLTSEFTAAHLAYRTLPLACGIWGALTLVLCVAIGRRTSAETA